MKKSLALLLFMVSCICSFAQVTMGFKVGLNANNTSYTNLDDLQNGWEDDSETKVAFHLGAYAKINLRGKFAFIPELQFIQKGYRVKLVDGFKVRLNYIELPLIFSYSPVKLIGLELGPVAGVLISARGKYDRGTFDMKNLYSKPFELGAAAGVRFNVSDKISFAARYYHGLTTISDIRYTQVDGGYRIREYNWNIQASVYVTLTKPE